MTPHLTLSSREKFIAVASGFLILIYVVYQTAYRPFAGLLAEIDQNILVKKDLLEKYASTVEQARVARTKLQTTLYGFRQALPTEQIMSQMLKKIEQAATQSGVQVSEIKPSPVTYANSANIFSFRIVAHGAHLDIFSFIHGLQDHPLSFQLESFEIKKFPSQKNTILCRFVINRTLIAPDPNTPSAVGRLGVDPSFATAP